MYGLGYIWNRNYRHAFRVDDHGKPLSTVYRKPQSMCLASVRRFGGKPNVLTEDGALVAADCVDCCHQIRLLRRQEERA